MKKIIKKECTVGYKCYFENEPNNAVWYEAGYTENGYCFKDIEAFSEESSAPCYIAENDEYWQMLDCCKTEEDYIALSSEIGNGAFVGYNYSVLVNECCDGVIPLAENVLYNVDWQFVETLLNEWSEDDLVEIFADVSDDNDTAFLKSLADIYDEEEYGTDWHNYYDFYMKHKKH